MRLFCPDCARQLMLEHSIKIDLVSNFTYCEGTLTLTKHQIRNSENIRQKLSLEKTKGMFCSSCTKTFMEVEKTLCQCDECGNKLVVKDVQPVGETIILCDGCLSRYKHFKDFKIFGLRGPDRKTRKKRYDESIAEVSAVREFPPEIEQMYEDGLEGNITESPFDEAEEELNIEELLQDESIIRPPQAQVTPDNFRRTNAPNEWGNGTWVARYTSTDSTGTTGE